MFLKKKKRAINSMFWGERKVNKDENMFIKILKLSVTWLFWNTKASPVFVTKWPVI